MSTDTVSITALSNEAEEVLAADAFNVDVEGFEGPLHMLLELARRQKIDLLQISMLKLAEQYLDFINDAKSKRIDIAADYLLMAAWLAYMKSRLMLPKPETDADDETSGEDMAARLAFRLKRLDAMREAGEALMAGPVLNNVVFLRGAPEQPKVVKTTEYDATLWHLTQVLAPFVNGERKKPRTQFTNNLCCRWNKRGSRLKRSFRNCVNGQVCTRSASSSVSQLEMMFRRIPCARACFRQRWN